MYKPELLAPAGSFEKAKVALIYGADAVYCGSSSLSLRSRASVENDDLSNIIKYAHNLGKKVYVAINIYAPDNMYDEIKEQVEILNKLYVDGVLVADGGVLDIVKEFAPDIPIHISTQANTLSAHTALFWYKKWSKKNCFIKRDE